MSLFQFLVWHCLTNTWVDMTVSPKVKLFAICYFPFQTHFFLLRSCISRWLIFVVAGARMFSALLNLVSHNCGPHIAFLLWNYTGLFWSSRSKMTHFFYYFHSFSPLPSCQVQRKWAVALLLTDSVYTSSATSGCECSFFGDAAWLSVAQAVWIASANINPVQLTSLNFHLGWYFPIFKVISTH